MSCLFHVGRIRERTLFARESLIMDMSEASKTSGIPPDPPCDSRFRRHRFKLPDIVGILLVIMLVGLPISILCRNADGARGGRIVVQLGFAISAVLFFLLFLRTSKGWLYRGGWLLLAGWAVWAWGTFDDSSNVWCGNCFEAHAGESALERLSCNFGPGIILFPLIVGGTMCLAGVLRVAKRVPSPQSRTGNSLEDESGSNSV